MDPEPNPLQIQRLKLQALLETLGAKKVYFQPTSNVSMTDYPVIVFKRDNRETIYANNSPYYQKTRYQVTVIDRDPDSLIVDKVANLPLCRSDRNFQVNNLNHDVFTIYF